MQISIHAVGFFGSDATRIGTGTDHHLCQAGERVLACADDDVKDER
jgi:hypothetical protein